MPYLPPFIAPARFTDPEAALAQVRAIYNNSLEHLRLAMQRFVAGDALPGHVRACYPFVRVHTDTVARFESPEGAGLSYGFVAGPGRFETTLTRPDLYGAYYLEQFRLLLQNHHVELEVGTSTSPIPIHFSFAEHDHIEGTLTADRRLLMRDVFDLPDLGAMDDGIANGTHNPGPGEAQPLSLFTAPRVDYSLHRLRHYTGTAPEWFQNFVLFTNYQFYIDEFVRLGHEAMADENSEFVAFVEPGNVVTRRKGLPAVAGDELGVAPPRLPQMPAYHLMRANHSGITMVNIGVGPANAKTITDHIAVLRPHAWMMLGHCAGLRNSQQLGDYVLAHAYVREDHVLDEELPLWVPIPALAEIQLALEQAVEDVTQVRGAALKSIMRTGTVASTDNRNWELLPNNEPQRRFSQSRAVALDMESATIAANGFRFRVPYGTLLCVSDKPLHGEIKLPGMANHFYRERVDQHLRIGIRAIEILRGEGVTRLHSRKLLGVCGGGVPVAPATKPSDLTYGNRSPNRSAGPAMFAQHSLTMAGNAVPVREITPEAPASATTHWWPRLRRWLLPAFAILVLCLLAANAHRVDWEGAWMALKRYPPLLLLTVLGICSASHALYGCFDLVGRRHTLHGLPAWRVWAISVTSYAFNLNLGSLVGGVAMRARLYARAGLDEATIAQVVGLSLTTNWLGYGLVAGSLFAADIITPPSQAHISNIAFRLIGVGLILLAVVYVAACAFCQGREWRVRGRTLHLPSAWLAMSCNWQSPRPIGP